MRAVDTNVLIPLVTRDDQAQARAAEAFVGKGAWVSHLVLAETMWVLSAAYELPREQIATAVAMLLEHQHLSIQDADVVDAALRQFRSRTTVGFSNCLMLEIARKAGHSPLGTFDRPLGQLEGAVRL